MCSGSQSAPAAARKSFVSLTTSTQEFKKNVPLMLAVLCLLCAGATAQTGHVGGELVVPGIPVEWATESTMRMPELPLESPQIPRLAGEDEQRKKISSRYDIARIGNRNVGKGLDFYSLEREIAMGQQMALEVELSSRILRDKVVAEYVNRLAQRLAGNSDSRVPFTVKVLDSDEINAFALPGGFFFLNTGLILAARSEAELAGVMAHEIAHVAARHATKNASKAQLLNLISIPLILVGGPVGYAAQQVLGLGVPLSMLKFSRNAEREADLLGLQYQYASGYDPEEFLRFLERLHAEDEDEGGSFLAKAFRTHPMTGDRVKRAQKQIGEYLPPREHYIVDTSEFAEIKARLIESGSSRRIDSGKQPRPVLRRRGVEKH